MNVNNELEYKELTKLPILVYVGTVCMRLSGNLLSSMRETLTRIAKPSFDASQPLAGGATKRRVYEMDDEEWEKNSKTKVGGD